MTVVIDPVPEAEEPILGNRIALLIVAFCLWPRVGLGELNRERSAGEGERRVSKSKTNGSQSPRTPRAFLQTCLFATTSLITTFSHGTRILQEKAQCAPSQGAGREHHLYRGHQGECPNGAVLQGTEDCV